MLFNLSKYLIKFEVKPFRAKLRNKETKNKGEKMIRYLFLRLVQRMGRTGRKREGRIVVLVTQGIEVA